MTLAYWYLNGQKAFNNGEIDFDTDTIRCMLLTSSYTPDQDAHDYLDDVRSYEVSGTGYTADGEALTTKAINVVGASNEIRLDADDVTWTSSTITARYAVVYKDTGTDGTSPLICYVDFESDQESSNGDFKITWASDGIAKATAS